MKNLNNNTHWKFAKFFKEKELSPFLYALSERMEQGNVCLDLTEMESYFHPEHHLFAKDWEINIQALKEHPLVGSSEEGSEPFVCHNNRLYTRRFFSYEQRFVHSIQAFINKEEAEEQRKKLLSNPTLLGMAQSLFPFKDEKEVNWQLVACLTAYCYRFSIITGGPGTGKTTTIAKLLSLLIASHSCGQTLKIKLAAPTGKASARMAESLAGLADNLKREGIELDEEILTVFQSIQPQTIHRLLGYQQKSIYFKHHQENPLDADIIVVDECSMIDISLFTKLLEAINPKTTRLILLGDRNQLASVEAGSLFGDLCVSLPQLNVFEQNALDFFGAVRKEMKMPALASPIESIYPLLGHVVELQHSYRFSDDKGIGQFSKAILRGDLEMIENQHSDAGIIVLLENENVETPAEYKNADACLEYFKRKIIESYTHQDDIEKALECINDYKILCATKKGNPGGVWHINQEIKKKVMNKNVISWAGAYHHQLLMVTQNQKDLNLDNGDIGIVKSDENGYLFAHFPNKKEAVSALTINAYDDAYAMTIHKSQGSEFQHVLIIIPPLPEKGGQFLTRELLYTAVTRAKKTAIILADKNTLKQVVSQKVKRISGVCDLLSSNEIIFKKKKGEQEVLG